MKHEAGSKDTGRKESGKNTTVARRMSRKVDPFCFSISAAYSPTILDVSAGITASIVLDAWRRHKLGHLSSAAVADRPLPVHKSSESECSCSCMQGGYLKARGPINLPVSCTALLKACQSLTPISSDARVCHAQLPGQVGGVVWQGMCGRCAAADATRKPTRKPTRNFT
jgi:hypothetical protein